MQICNFLLWSAFISFFMNSLSANYDLVNLRTINPYIQIDMRYATSDNPLGFPLYSSGECYLVPEVAYKLSGVQKELEKMGYGLKVWDAYRPHNQQLYLSCKVKLPFDNLDAYLYSLEHSNGNSRGTSVDVTLVSLSGYAPIMPTDFGRYDLGTARDNRWLPANVYHHVHLLEQKMQQFGFVPSPIAWWHFDYCSESCYPILDVSIEELASCNCRK